MDEVFTTTDSYGRTRLCRASDFIKPLTAFQLVTAFPGERLAARRRLRILMEDLNFYKQKIRAIMTLDIPKDAKYLSIKIAKGLMTGDPNFIEAQKLQRYLAMIPKQATYIEKENPTPQPSKPHMEPFNIEKAKQYPILDLYDFEMIKHNARNVSCLCPFHNDTKPSFMIYLDTNSYHCFTCKASGDVINFVMNIYNEDFKQAIRRLT